MDLYKGEAFNCLSEGQWQSFSSSSSTKNKSLKKTQEIAKICSAISPDIFFFNEVGGLESLANFNKYFLSSAYTPFLVPGNSDRGIDVGYLVKKDLNFLFKHISHKNRLIPLSYDKEEKDVKHHFSRDISELRLLSKDQSKVLGIFLITHLKSKLDLKAIDFEGIKRRTAEVESLVDLYNELSTEFDGKIPVVIAGDFNGIAHKEGHSIEFNSLYDKSDLKACMDILNVDDEARTTKVQFSRTSRPRHIQIDFIFLSPHWQKNINFNETYVYRFKSKKGEAMPLPVNLEERYSFPSDHYPIVLTLENLELE